jgi:hypothetical protein
MRVFEIAVAARQGITEMRLSQTDMDSLKADLEEEAQYGRPIEPPFFLYGVYITLDDPMCPPA